MSVLLALILAAMLAACSAGRRGADPPPARSRGATQAAHPAHPAAVPSVTATPGLAPRPAHPVRPGSAGQPDGVPSALPPPAALAPFGGPARTGAGTWRPVGRRVRGLPAVYTTKLIPPGGHLAAGLAWMDTRLLSARLYSGSVSPGGGPYRFTAPIRSAQAASLVAAFNGGFKMRDAHGGYYIEGRQVDPLRRGAASLVIYDGGSVTIGAWGSDATMTQDVIAVRQNLVPLVAAGRPTRAAMTHWRAWGSTCGAISCAASVPGIEHQWRSGAGVTADGALVYAAGPALDPAQLARLLVRAGVVRGMELDINPYWPVFASYDPPPGTAAGPATGHRLLASMVQGPGTFFQPSWARDFVTMSERPRAG